MPHPLSERVKVIGFDVFGTVVDWYSSIAREVEAIAPGVDGGAFALAWRAGYWPAFARVRRGETGWTKLDVLHREILDDILPKFGMDDLDEAARRHLNLAWHRLDPWPDAIEGLTRLKRRYVICPLSNGNIGLLADMAKRAGIPWDLILSAEVFRHYKPDPEAYLGLPGVFDLQPGEAMLVATHQRDLAGAKACGLATAFVERPLEMGPGGGKDDARDPRFDLHATDFNDLADQLGC